MTIDLEKYVEPINSMYAQHYKDIKSNIKSEISIGDLDEEFFAPTRFLSGVGVLYLTYIIFLVVLYILRKTLLNLLQKICFGCFNMCCGKEKGKHTFSKDILADLRIEILSDFYKKTVVDYADLNKLHA